MNDILIKYNHMNIRKILKAVLFVLLVLLFSCKEDYMPEIDDYEDLLVVEGIIDGFQGPYQVQLSRSVPLSDMYFAPYEFCEVLIIDDEGAEMPLVESDPGLYQQKDFDFCMKENHHYKLKIKTPGGKNYESEWESFHEAVGIDTVYAEIHYKAAPYLNRDYAGYQFFVNTKPLEKDTCFFLWLLDETWEFNADFYIDKIYHGPITDFENFDSVYTCWRTEIIKDIFSLSVQGHSNPEVSAHKLNFVDTETRKLSVRYSLNVKQFTVDRKAYEYWSSIGSLISEDASLFASQPYHVQGNIRCTDDDDEVVLGYFSIAGMDEMRVFVNPPVDASFYYPECTPITDLRGLGFTPPSQYPVYLTVLENGKMAYAGKACFDCTLNGGGLDKPEFWYYD